MSEKDLERDHITVNTTIYCEIPLQLDNQKFIYKPITTIYRVSHEKNKDSAVFQSNVIDENNDSCFERLLTAK